MGADGRAKGVGMGLRELERELPALASQATPGREIDWSVVENGSGDAPARRFRHLCERYAYLALDRPSQFTSSPR